LIIAQEELRAAEGAVVAKEAELRRMTLNDPKTAVLLREIQVTRAEAALEGAKDALAKHVVTAPCTGTVLRLNVGAGDTISGLSHQAAIEFCPDVPRIVRAEVEQAYAALVAEGQEVTVQDDTHAPGTWTGRVKRVADWFIQQRPLMQEPLQFNDV